MAIAPIPGHLNNLPSSRLILSNGPFQVFQQSVQTTYTRQKDKSPEVIQRLKNGYKQSVYNLGKDPVLAPIDYIGDGLYYSFLTLNKFNKVSDRALDAAAAIAMVSYMYSLSHGFIKGLTTPANQFETPFSTHNLSSPVSQPTSLWKKIKSAYDQGIDFTMNKPELTTVGFICDLGFLITETSALLTRNALARRLRDGLFEPVCMAIFYVPTLLKTGHALLNQPVNQANNNGTNRPIQTNQ